MYHFADARASRDREHDDHIRATEELTRDSKHAEDVQTDDTQCKNQSERQNAADITIRRILGPCREPRSKSQAVEMQTDKTQLDILALDLSWWIGSDLSSTLEPWNPYNGPENISDLTLGFCGPG